MAALGSWSRICRWGSLCRRLTSILRCTLGDSHFNPTMHCHLRICLLNAYAGELGVDWLEHV